MKITIDIDPISGSPEDKLIFLKVLEAVQMINQMGEADPQDVPIPYTPTEQAQRPEPPIVPHDTAIDPVHEDEDLDDSFDVEALEAEESQVQTKPEKVANETSPKATLDQARDQAREFIATHGKAKAVEILKATTGSTNLTDAPEEKLGAFVEACKAYDQ